MEGEASPNAMAADGKALSGGMDDASSYIDFGPVMSRFVWFHAMQAFMPVS